MSSFSSRARLWSPPGGRAHLCSVTSTARLACPAVAGVVLDPVEHVGHAHARPAADVVDVQLAAIARPVYLPKAQSRTPRSLAERDEGFLMRRVSLHRDTTLPTRRARVRRCGQNWRKFGRATSLVL